MRVLLSAYACEPNRGSEPEVGWQRVLHMPAHADEVWVITRANNREAIEAEPASPNSKIHFIYYDLPQWALRLKKQSWFLPMYFVLWQWGAYRAAKLYHRESPFECVYHVTFCTMLFGSFMGRLRIPFIIGPIGGGEWAPSRLRRSMTLLGKASEFLRDAEIVLQRYSPLSAMAFSSAERIYVTTHDSLRLIRSKWHGKTEVQIAVANHSPVVERREHSISMTPRFVFAGRLLRWKGVHLAIPALAEARKVLPSATLTVYGNGPDERWLRGIAERLGIADAVEFNGELPRQKLTSALSGFTALVFPSLHDAGGMIVLEALSKGLPVVCLDLGGPGTLVNASCGMLISTKDADETRIVSDIAKAMIALGTMPAPELALLSMGAMARAEELSWTALTKRVVASRGRDISKDGGFTTAA